MMVFLNGRFVPEEQATVSVFDRSFLYGDGLFESMRVTRGKPFRWWDHMERLRKGGDFLGIRIPFACKSLEKFAAELIAKNQMPESLLRLTVSRGVGLRGYSPKGAATPSLVMTLHALPPAPAAGGGWRLHTASLRLAAGEKLAQFKTANKLAQVLARAEAEAAGADEALLLNTDGFVVEGASSNLFWVEGDTICTPPLASGILAGVTRAVIVELCQQLILPVAEREITAEGLREVSGIFVTLSSLGVVECRELDGVALARSPLVERLCRAYDEQLLRE
ncbi:MAG TPA: aminodeoxychorismate lyase [Verrucomicrobiae bacterium]|nr:aminodeoxychorismate lyase [Verrucomicrobiae bacterium]